MRILVDALKDFLGKTVTVEGWGQLSPRPRWPHFHRFARSHRYHSLVIIPETKDAFALAETIRDEFVLKATGTMREREPDLINPNILTGKIELVVENLELLNKSEL